MFVNPTKAEVKALIDSTEEDYEEIRVVFYNNNIYAWDAYKATHEEVAKALGFDYHLEDAHTFSKSQLEKANYVLRPDIPWYW